MRSFRQRRLGEWGEVIERMAEALAVAGRKWGGAE
jgi:hypothetical protein